MTAEEILALAARADNPALAQREADHVQRIWSDGELTSEKGGSLLGMRSLHQFCAPVPSAHVLGLHFPHRGRVYTYAWVTWRDGVVIHDAIAELAGVPEYVRRLAFRGLVAHAGAADPEDRLPWPALPA